MRVLAMLSAWNRFLDWLEEKAAERKVEQSRREFDRQWEQTVKRHGGDPQAVFLDTPVQVPRPRRSSDSAAPAARA
jgi:hypothetical protein